MVFVYSRFKMFQNFRSKHAGFLINTTHILPLIKISISRLSPPPILQINKQWNGDESTTNYITLSLSLSFSAASVSSSSQLAYTSNGEFHQDADESMGSPPPETRFGAQVPSLVSGGVNFFLSGCSSNHHGNN